MQIMRKVISVLLIIFNVKLKFYQLFNLICTLVIFWKIVHYGNVNRNRPFLVNAWHFVWCQQTCFHRWNSLKIDLLQRCCQNQMELAFKSLHHRNNFVHMLVFQSKFLTQNVANHRKTGLQKRVQCLRSIRFYTRFANLLGASCWQHLFGWTKCEI